MPGGVGGDANEQEMYRRMHLPCRRPDNSVTVILDEYLITPRKLVRDRLPIDGGPEIGLNSHTGGFALTVTSGVLAASEASEDLVENWEGDESSLTHTDAGSEQATGHGHSSGPARGRIYRNVIFIIGEFGEWNLAPST